MLTKFVFEINTSLLCGVPIMIYVPVGLRALGALIAIRVVYIPKQSI